MILNEENLEKKIRILEILREMNTIFDGSPWFGDSVMSLLERVSPANINLKINDSSHSIFQIIKHVTAWKKFVVKKIEGDNEYMIEIDSEDDWVSKSSQDAQEWKSVIDELKEVHEEMMVTLATLEDSILDTYVPGTKYRFELMIRGVIMHDVYHLGQLALLNAAFTKK